MTDANPTLPMDNVAPSVPQKRRGRQKKELTPEEIEHRRQLRIARARRYYESHREQCIAKVQEYYETHKRPTRPYMRKLKEAKEKMEEYERKMKEYQNLVELKRAELAQLI